MQLPCAVHHQSLAPSHPHHWTRPQRFINSFSLPNQKRIPLWCSLLNHIICKQYGIFLKLPMEILSMQISSRTGDKDKQWRCLTFWKEYRHKSHYGHTGTRRLQSRNLMFPQCPHKIPWETWSWPKVHRTHTVTSQVTLAELRVFVHCYSTWAGWHHSSWMWVSTMNQRLPSSTLVETSYCVFGRSGQISLPCCLLTPSTTTAKEYSDFASSSEEMLLQPAIDILSLK